MEAHVFIFKMLASRTFAWNYEENCVIIQLFNLILHSYINGIHGSMGRECKTFYVRLEEICSEKRKTHSTLTIYWVRTNILSLLISSFQMGDPFSVHNKSPSQTGLSNGIKHRSYYMKNKVNIDIALAYCKGFKCCFKR